MGYEARQEAMNDFIAERARELMPDEDEYTLDEDIPERIAEGIYDKAVKKRIKVLFDGWTPGQRSMFHKLLLEGLE